MQGFTGLSTHVLRVSNPWLLLSHPVLAGDVLVVRNGEEMAAFRMSRAGR
jgi:hypothetical protein